MIVLLRIPIIHIRDSIVNGNPRKNKRNPSLSFAGLGLVNSATLCEPHAPLAHVGLYSVIRLQVQVCNSPNVWSHQVNACFSCGSEAFMRDKPLTAISRTINKIYSSLTVANGFKSGEIRGKAIGMC